MAVLRIEPLHEDFGARVQGIDLRQPLAPEAVREIQAAIDQHSFLYFPDQQMDDERHLAFTRSLGELEESHVALGQTGQINYLGTIGNVQPDGSRLGSGHKKTIFLTGNNMWHTDSSFREVPSRLSIMCAYEVPEAGGATEFASARAAYQRLDAAMQERIEPLVAIHDYVFSRSKVGPDAVTPSHAAAEEQSPHVPRKTPYPRCGKSWSGRTQARGRKTTTSAPTSKPSRAGAIGTAGSFSTTCRNAPRNRNTSIPTPGGRAIW